MLYPVGITINPKTGVPAFVFQRDESNAPTIIFTVDDSAKGMVYQGSGYFDDGEYRKATELTGYPRVHTPNGVFEKGMGYGTCLYTGLACTAYQNSQNSGAARWFRGTPGAGEEGISSEETSRSAEADKWWGSAVEHGLATQVSGDVEEEVEDVEVDNDYARQSLDGYDDIDVSYASAYVSGTKTTEVDDVNVLTFENVERASLVGAIFDLSSVEEDEHTMDVPRSSLGLYIHGPVADWAERMDPELVDLVDAKALGACNLMGLPEEVFWLLAKLVYNDGGRERVAEQMLIRWRASVDPNIDPGAWGIAGQYVPNAAEIERALEETLETRHELGWDQLADMP